MKESIVFTQEHLSRLTKERNRLQRQLADAEARVLAALDLHQTQIRLSLQSTDPEERRAAESIAAWWGVPVTERAAPREESSGEARRL